MEGGCESGERVAREILGIAERAGLPDRLYHISSAVTGRWSEAPIGQARAARTCQP